MSNREELLTPVGRLVQGSLYDPQTTDAENRPLVVKTGVNAGQPRVEYYFGLAIPKGNEQHWNQTPWGQIIWAVGHKGFPNGQANSPAFAWKIQDGDSQIPNKAGRKNCDREGYPGHWVLNFACGFAPGIHVINDGIVSQLTEPHAINLGDYIEVYGSVSDNGSSQQPGVFLNHSMVCLAGYGKRIVLGVDVKSIGFGKAALPVGASKTPISQGFVPPVAQAAPAPAAYAAPAPVAAPTPPPVPHTAILTPPAPPAAPQRVMTEKAQGNTYEAMIAQGWTDAMLVQHGYMLA
jgi:hypothetical protein